MSVALNNFYLTAESLNKLFSMSCCKIFYLFSKIRKKTERGENSTSQGDISRLCENHVSRIMLADNC